MKDNVFDLARSCPTQEQLDEWLNTTNRLDGDVSLGRFGPLGCCSFLVFSDEGGSKISTFFLGYEPEELRSIAAHLESIAKACEILHRGDEQEIQKEFLDLAEETPTTLLN